MTQEQRDLLMKDLSSRLPHGVKVQVDQQGLQEYDNYWTVWDLDKEVQEVDGVYVYGVTLDCMAMVDGVIPFEFIKPYLFPMSSMTEKQKNELDQLFKMSLKALMGEITDTYVDTLEFDFYNKHHLDWRGLIPKGLALDATGLNIY